MTWSLLNKEATVKECTGYYIKDTNNSPPGENTALRARPFSKHPPGKFPAPRLTRRWLIPTVASPPVAAHTAAPRRESYLFVNMADKNHSAAAVEQAQVDKARHIPGGWNFIRSTFTTTSCQPVMTDTAGIPLITKLLQKRNFFNTWKTIIFTPEAIEIFRMNLENYVWCLNIYILNRHFLIFFKYE